VDKHLFQHDAPPGNSKASLREVLDSIRCTLTFRPLISIPYFNNHEIDHLLTPRQVYRQQRSQYKYMPSEALLRARSSAVAQGFPSPLIQICGGKMSLSCAFLLLPLVWSARFGVINLQRGKAPPLLGFCRSCPNLCNKPRTVTPT
jgi:hypothetical protein